MTPLTIGVLAVSMSVDAFIASLGRGATERRPGLMNAVRTGAIFGAVEMVTPLIGWGLGMAASAWVQAVDHWIAFALLLVIGGNMIKESFSEAEKLNDDFGFKTMVLLAVATSIDALAVGITFAFLQVRIVPAASLIGVTTFCLSALGIYIGHRFGARYKARAERVGGVILILIGVKILLEHLGVINF